nr:hypothetical protein Iba_chr11eCG13020 [Ipomoea batatas]
MRNANSSILYRGRGLNARNRMWRGHHANPRSQTKLPFTSITPTPNLSHIWNFGEKGIASVCLPPAATLTIFTPGFNVTKQGSADRLSSDDGEPSAVCLEDDMRLLFAPSSPLTPPLSKPDILPPVDLDPWERGLTVI